MMTLRDAKKNVKHAYLLMFMSEFYLPISIWLYFFSDFLSFREIAILTSIQVLSGVIFELPTGAIADLIGRKLSLLLSFAISAIALLMYGSIKSFEVFAVLEVFRGLGNAFYSGTLEAVVYDSLEETKTENTYDKIVANQESLVWIALFGGAILGGYLFNWYKPLPYLAQGVLYLFTLPLIWTMTEPARKKRLVNALEFVKQNLRGMRELFKTSKLSIWSGFFIIIGLGYFASASILGISQAKEMNLDSRGVGYLFGFGYLLSAVASQAYPRLKKIFGERILLLVLATTLISSLLFARFVGLVGGSLLILTRIASSTTFRNLRSSVINKLISSDNRASALSALALLTSLPYAISAFALGEYIDMTSANHLAFLLGLIILILVGLLQAGYGLSKILR